MEGYIQALAAVLLTVVLGLLLRKQGMEIGVLLSIAVCCMVLCIGLRYLEPVVDLVRQLRDRTQIAPEYITILLKVLGIGLIGEIAALICADAGNSALAKAVQMISSIVILWLSIPMFESLMETVQEVLGQA